MNNHTPGLPENPGTRGGPNRAPRERGDKKEQLKDLQKEVEKKNFLLTPIQSLLDRFLRSMKERKNTIDSTRSAVRELPVPKNSPTSRPGASGETPNQANDVFNRESLQQTFGTDLPDGDYPRALRPVILQLEKWCKKERLGTNFSHDILDACLGVMQGTVTIVGWTADAVIDIFRLVGNPFSQIRETWRIWNAK